MSIESYADLKRVYASVTGMEPTEVTMASIFGYIDATGIQYNDPSLLQIIALEHYKTLFADIPKEMEKATNFMLTEGQRALAALFKRGADEIKAAQEQAKLHIAKVANDKLHELMALTKTELVTAINTIIASEIKTQLTQPLAKETGIIKQHATEAVNSIDTAAKKICRSWKWNWVAFVLCSLVAGGAGGQLIRIIEPRLTPIEQQYLNLGQAMNTHWKDFDVTTQEKITKVVSGKK